MLTHTRSQSSLPERVVVLGAGGFVGSHLIRRLQREAVDTVALRSRDLDLTRADAASRLAEMLRPSDALVFLACITPDKGRDASAAMSNVAMAHAVVQALQVTSCDHVVYFGSDAVYPMVGGETTEASPATPVDLYGVAHLCREMMLRSACSGNAPLAILRPTMVYGAGDTHNAYGPNRFLRSAASDRVITLFGNGEEYRDHVHVEDVVNVTMRVLGHRSDGLLNVATGRSITFSDLARRVARLFDEPVRITSQPRRQAITHRRFDAAAVRLAWPDFQFIGLAEGLEQTRRAMTGRAESG